jgi:predicted nucleic acid-binding Zn ribbon protein
MIDPWTGENRDRGLNLLEATLEEVLERATEGRLVAFEVVKEVWQRVVPPTVRERSRPLKLERGVLTVEVSDGGVASRIRLEQAKIRAALEEQVGRDEVAQIKLKVGRGKDWPSRR